MTSNQREWCEARDRLRKAVIELGYPSDLADLFARELGRPRGLTGSRPTSTMQSPGAWR